ncbi:glycosyl transferase [Acetobacter pasteurianus subsp. pasteurianus LMG 1262 = NBRC 106471]|uniref:glycosyltransferase n=1 Tax=Acetobacter pasteurianus TaxID=438 RepID=UPI0002457F48|nr:glycosyltransferase [Acetobacter pasteurianus]GAB31443.1 glycosyl transferase [Acetobacter pasteurianus subsp. pasteurianus LMG 1262 = NBRC 106471]GCD50845.1 glycosyl transferase [Acetobacter pasteurianus subsp. pasteurianus LMG 1262 = NBRC 106471]
MPVAPSSLSESLSSLEDSPLFTPIVLIQNSTSGCENIPFLTWILKEAFFSGLLLVGSSLSVKETLNFSSNIHPSPFQLTFQSELPSSITRKNQVIYIAARMWQSAEPIQQFLNTAPEGTLLLLEDIKDSRRAEAWEHLSALFPSFALMQGKGLGLLATTEIACLFPLLTPDSRLSDAEKTTKCLLRERFAFAGDFWFNKALLDAAHTQINTLKQDLVETRSHIFSQQMLTHHENDQSAQKIDSLQKVFQQTQKNEQALIQEKQEITDRLAAFIDAVKQRDLCYQQQTEALNNQIRALNTYIESLKQTYLSYTQHIHNLWSRFAQEVLDRTEAQNALKTYLSTPSGIIRSIARALVKGVVVPYVPDLPQPPQIEPVPQAPPAPQPLVLEYSSTAPLAFPEVPETDSIPALEQPSQGSGFNVLFVAGEPDSPGVNYRCIRNAAACSLVGFPAQWKRCADVGPDDINWADVMVLWRVEFSGHVDIMLRLAREQNMPVIFDTDDLTFIPGLARMDIIDGIRSIGATEERIETVFTDMQRTLLRTDIGFAPTDTLADAMRVYQPVTYTVPNIYNTECLALSRKAYRMRQLNPDEQIIRIGYATGSRTHQKDFAQVSRVLARLLLEKPNLRLVLFRETGNHRPVLLMNEFPEFEPVYDQIEWRDMCSLPDLPSELARFDISIAPLETQNPFCNAKSELKFFEAALAGVPSIVSPTAPFRQCVKNGLTGLFATTPEEWETALRTLIENPDLRHRMAQNAYHAALWHFGPQRQAILLGTIMESLKGEKQAAKTAEIQIARSNYLARNLPDIPDCNVLFLHDALQEANVTVIITSYNYESFILEALESVRLQTLPVLDLVVVDDGSSDGSLSLIKGWMEKQTVRFNRLVLLQTNTNAGLGGARNCGVAYAETPFFLPLDADNRLLPHACETLLNATDALTAYAYPIIQQFGDPAQHPTLGQEPFQPMQLVAGNYIDAMALVAKWAWSAAGGYYVSRDAMGWEDYDLWCTMAEYGLRGTHVPEVLAEYRVHQTSMTNNVTEKMAHKQRVVSLVEARHPWIRLVQKSAKQREVATS